MPHDHTVLSRSQNYSLNPGLENMQTDLKTDLLSLSLERDRPNTYTYEIHGLF